MEDGFYEACSNWVQLRTLKMCGRMPIDERETPPHFTTFLTGLTALTELEVPRVLPLNMRSLTAWVLPTQLQILDVSDTHMDIGPILSPILSQMTDLRSLGISFCRLDDAKLADLTPSLLKLPHLTCLQISGSDLRGDEVDLLIPRLTQLQVLHFAACDLDDDHTARLVDLLHAHTLLRSLDIGHNDISTKTIQALVNLPRLPYLERIGWTPDSRRPNAVENILRQSLTLVDIWDSFQFGKEQETIPNNLIRNATLVARSGNPEKGKGTLLVREKAGEEEEDDHDEFMVGARYPNYFLYEQE